MGPNFLSSSNILLKYHMVKMCFSSDFRGYHAVSQFDRQHAIGGLPFTCSHTCSRQRDKVNREHQVPINLLSNKATREQGGKICSIVVPHFPFPIYHVHPCTVLYSFPQKSEFCIILQPKCTPIYHAPPFTVHPHLPCTFAFLREAR